ncbi:MAG: hypothetical protein ACOZAR_00965 [Patescibacteria group bacterium]
MPTDQKNKYIQKINQKLEKYQLESIGDLSEIVENTIINNENNFRFFCQTKNEHHKKFFLKFQRDKSRQKHDIRSRRQYNLSNEINFYQEFKTKKFKKLVIPNYYHSGKKPNPWLITKKINQKEISALPANTFFSRKKIPLRFASIVIDGLTELHQQKINPKKFYRQKMQDLINWFQFLSQSFTGEFSPLTIFVPRILIKNEKIWNENSQNIIHGDLVSDTFAFSNKNKLVLFDFEKVQISNPAFDFSSFVINPYLSTWNRYFEKEITRKNPGKTFKTLFYLSWIMRLCHLSGNFLSGRLDHVFKPIIGEKNFCSTKNIYLHLWPKEIYRLLDQINKIN